MAGACCLCLGRIGGRACAGCKLGRGQLTTSLQPPTPATPPTRPCLQHLHLRAPVSSPGEPAVFDSAALQGLGQLAVLSLGSFAGGRGRVAPSAVLCPAVLRRVVRLGAVLASVPGLQAPSARPPACCRLPAGPAACLAAPPGARLRRAEPAAQRARPARPHQASGRLGVLLRMAV